MYYKILVCVDDTPHSERAAWAAADLAGRYEAEIVLLTILDPARLPEQPYTGLEAIQLLDRHSRSLSDNTQRLSGMLHDRGIRNRTMPLRGRSASLVLEAAEAEAADLIIFGAETKGRLRAWLNNDLWNEVSHKAACHVLRVTPPPGKPDMPNGIQPPKKAGKDRNLLTASLSAL